MQLASYDTCRTKTKIIYHFLAVLSQFST